MLSQLELFTVGLAAVVDFVLLIVVLEPGNRRRTAVWLWTSLAGAFLWHGGSFVHLALAETVGAAATQLDVLVMTVATAGLLTITSGILHAAFRIQRTGPGPGPNLETRYALLYLPVLFTVPVLIRLLQTQERSYVVATQPFHLLYFGWLLLANTTCVVLFLRNRFRLTQRTSGARFLLKFCGGLVLATVLTGIYLQSQSPGDGDRPLLRLLATLSPVFPALIFAYYIFRRRILPLVFERTLVYAACFLSIFYLHRLIVNPVLAKYGDRFRFDFYLVEGAVLIAIILGLKPLRRRVNEGLRYLIGSDVVHYRDRVREIAIQLTQRSSDAPAKLVKWFAEELRSALQLQFVEVSLRLPEEHDWRVVGEVTPDVEDRQDVVDGLSEQRQKLMGQVHHWVDRTQVDSTEIADLLYALDLSAACPMREELVDGHVLLGATLSGDRLLEEQSQATTLLIDQLAAVLQNQCLQQRKRSAERMAVQQEKLSTLGLLSGSIAHEIRNPLSSIRTIATLMREDLGGESQHSEDLDLIVSEIDRLTQTTSQLLQFAKPEQTSDQECSIADVVEGIVQILSHLARRHTVTLEVSGLQTPQLVKASRAAATDILLNIIKNAIEAAADSGARRVTIDVRSVTFHAQVPKERRLIESSGEQFVAVCVQDSGNGISADSTSELFQPFYTSKAEGTGLGLYLVSERLREIHGEVQCRSDRSRGTEFLVLLPESERDLRS